MRTVFADTGFWIAGLDPRDHLHRRARSVRDQLGPVRLVTSEWIFSEVLNTFSARGLYLRGMAAALCQRLPDYADVEMLPANSNVFHRALDLYARREDQTWGLIDCTSFVIMRERGLTDALTHDHHFRQAGFNPLLREA